MNDWKCVGKSENGCAMVVTIRENSWISAKERLPEQHKKVMAVYKSKLGEWITVMAEYVYRFTVDCDCDYGYELDDTYTEYCEENEETYLKAGWYEKTENSLIYYDKVRITEGVVEYWKELPEIHFN